MQWTSEQREAIEARHTNLLLAAAAGSGKTTVLVERVLRLVLEAGADRIVAGSAVFEGDIRANTAALLEVLKEFS